MTIIIRLPMGQLQLVGLSWNGFSSGPPDKRKKDD